MLWPAYALDVARNSWLWWAWVDETGKAGVAPGKKYQQERWHLRALHDVGVFNALAQGIACDLALQHGSAKVRIGSVWVDHTPQAKTKYVGPAGSTPRSAKCELADLLVVTYVKLAGRPPRTGDTKALLVQAKVTDSPGILDATGGARSSSFKERNLLECCSAPIITKKLSKGFSAKGRGLSIALRNQQPTVASLRRTRYLGP